MPSTRNPATVVDPGPGLIPTGVVTSSSIIGGGGGGGDVTALSRPLPILNSTDVAPGHGGSLFLDIVPSPVTGTFWVSDVAGTAITELFTITDLNDHPIYVGTVLVQATNFTGSLPSVPTIGSGLVNRNPLRVNFTATIPNGQGFRVYYGIGYTLATIPENSWVRKDIPNSGNGAGFEFVDDTNLTDTALGDISVKSGGVGNPVNIQQKAFDNIDLRLTKLRGFIATVSNNATSFGGDYNSNILDTLVDASSGSLLQKGLLSVRPGAYKITNLATGWSARSIMVAAGGDSTAIYVDTTRVSNVILTSGQRLENIGLGTLDNAYRYEVQEDFYLDLSTSVNRVEAGALLLNGVGIAPSPKIVLKGVVATGNSTITTATSCLEITGQGVIEISDCEYGVSAFPTLSTITSILNIHNFTDAYGSISIRNCQFHINGAAVTGASGLLMTDVLAPVRFTDCRFQLFGATGDSWALSATDCHSIVFENCIFSNDLGQVIRCVNSGITFIECQFTGGATATLVNPRLICGEGYDNGGTDQTHKLRFINCIATFGAANVKASGAPSLPIVELGGRPTSYSGAAATVTGFIPFVNIVTLSGLTGITQYVKGDSIIVSGAVNPGNNGTFTITGVVPGVSVNYTNAGGVSPDAGPITWSITNVATPFQGGVEVDGLKIRPSSNALGVHNFTTVLLHDHTSNSEPNRYDNVTVDMLGCVPANTGTIRRYDQISGFGGGGMIVEVVGAEPVSPATSDSAHAKVRVENLRILAVGSPTAANPARGVVSAAWASIAGLVVDGSGTAAFHYTAPPIQLNSVALSDLQVFPSQGIPVKPTSLASMLYATGGSSISGLRYHHRGITTFGGGFNSPMFVLAVYSVIHKALVYVDVDITEVFIVSLGLRTSVLDSQFVVKKVTGGGSGFIADGGSESVTVADSTFVWNNVAPDTLAANITGNFASVSGNRFLTTSGVGADAPTTTISGANIIDINILDFGASAIAPQVY